MEKQTFSFCDQKLQHQHAHVHSLIMVFSINVLYVLSLLFTQFLGMFWHSQNIPKN